MSPKKHENRASSSGARRTQSWPNALRVLSFMGAAVPGASLMLDAPSAVQAQAQAPTISYPQEGQAVRGRIKVLFEGVPEGGYASIYVDLKPGGSKLDSFRGAVTGNSYEVNTLPLADGRHTVTIVTFNGSGRRLGQAEVGFNVANSQVDVSAERVRLLNWTLQDRNNPDVQRFRVFAESSSTTSTGGALGGAGAASPLDWQVDLVLRRMVRDVGMIGGAANIKLNVKEAFHRQRGGADEQATGDGTASTPRKVSTGGKAAWGKWVPAMESGTYFVKMIMPTGQEINANRKATTIALGDITPLFPEDAVQPGSVWETEMTLVAELSRRIPINVRGRMGFTSFENLQTQAGIERRCARLESEFDLPENVAMRIAKSLQSAGGSGAGGGAATPELGAAAMGRQTGSEAGIEAASGPEIAVARTHVRRVVWFDIAGRRVLRSEDYVDTYYEEEMAAVAAPEASMVGMAPFGMGGDPGMAGGMGGMPAPAAPAEPTRVNYSLRVIKYLDDTPPPPTDLFTAGAGTAHARDSVQDPALSRVTGRR